MSIVKFAERDPALHERLLTLQESFSKTSSNVGFAAYVLGQKWVPEEEYFSWAQAHYQCALLKNDYFMMHNPSLENWQKWQALHPWRQDLVPIGEWDGVLLVGCMEKPEMFPQSLNVCFILCPVAGLQSWWLRCQAFSNPMVSSQPALSPTPATAVAPAPMAESLGSVLEVSEELSIAEEPQSPIKQNEFELQDTDSEDQEASDTEDDSVIDTSEALEGFEDLQLESAAPPMVNGIIQPIDLGESKVAEDPSPMTMIRSSPAAKNPEESSPLEMLTLTVNAPKLEKTNLTATIAAPPSLSPPLPPAPTPVLGNSAGLNIVTKPKVAPVTSTPAPVDELVLDFNDEPSASPPTESLLELAPQETIAPPPPKAPSVAAVALTPPAATPPKPAPEVKAVPKPAPQETRAQPKTVTPALPLATGVFEKLFKNVPALKGHLQMMCEPMKNYFDKYALFEVNETETDIRSVLWSDTFKGNENYNLSVTDPSIFYIVAATYKAFHGPIIPNEINEKFFEDWNQGTVPDHATLVPLIFKDKLLAILMGIGEKSAYSHQVLRSTEKLAQEVSKKLNETMKRAA